jgi:uncharacterized repeat protein (TIGR02543 family)
MKNITLYVPPSSIAAYEAADAWKDFGSIKSAYYVVKFDPQEGSELEPQNFFIFDENKAEEPTEPTREGYTFGGWYKEAELTNAWNFDTEITDDITLYAKWMKNEVSISSTKKSTNKHGILFNNPVWDKAEINIILPNNEKVLEAKIVIYDMAGNVVFASTPLSNRSVVSNRSAASDTERSRSVVWDLTNNAGRYVANGTYLVIAEAKGITGKVYRYQAKMGVKR